MKTLYVIVITDSSNVTFNHSGIYSNPLGFLAYLNRVGMTIVTLTNSGGIYKNPAGDMFTWKMQGLFIEDSDLAELLS